MSYVPFTLNQALKQTEKIKTEMTLCKPDYNRTELNIINSSFGLEYTEKFGDVNVLSFSIPQVIDGVINDEYELIKGDYVIKLNFDGNISYFIIDQATENIKKGDNRKEVLAYSFEFIFANKIVRGWEEGQQSLQYVLDYVLSLFPSWSYGDVDAELMLKERTMEVSEKSVLEFLTDIQQTYVAVFKFDTVNRQLSVVKLENVGHNKGFVLSERNYADKIEIKPDYKDLVTRLLPYGDDIDIRSVSQTGLNYIDNLDYYKGGYSSTGSQYNWTVTGHSEFMSDGLCSGLKDLEIEIETQSGNIATERANLTILQGEIDVLLYRTDTPKGLEVLQNELKTIQLQIDGAIRIGTTDLSALKTQETAKIAEVDARQIDVDTKQGEIDSSIALIQSYSDALDLVNFLTLDEIKELDMFIVEQSWQDDNYFDEQELYDDAVTLLDTLSTPKINFTVDAINFLRSLDRSIDWEFVVTGIGDTIVIDIDSTGLTFEVRLVEFKYAPSKKTLQLKFTNKGSFDDPAVYLKDILKSSISTSQTLKMNRVAYGSYDKERSTISQYIDNALDLANQEAHAGVEQEIVINERGIQIINTVDPDKQLKMIGDLLIFTSDGYNSVGTAISSNGIVAQSLYGKIIAGATLQIETGNGEFVVDQNGVVIKNSSLTFTNDSGGTEGLLGTSLESDIQNLINNALQEDNPYNGVRIDTVDGLVVRTNDLDLTGTIKTTLNASEGIKMEHYNGSTWDTKLYIDSATGNIFLNDIVAENIQLNSGLIKKSSGETVINLATGEIFFDDMILTGSISWNNISGAPTSSWVNPDYIESTKITSTTIESPTITAGTINGTTIIGGTIEGGTLYGNTFTTASSEFPEKERIEITTGNDINFYNDANDLVATFDYDTNGAGEEWESENRMFIKTADDYALKLESGANADISISAGGGDVWIGGNLHVSGESSISTYDGTVLLGETVGGELDIPVESSYNYDDLDPDNYSKSDPQLVSITSEKYVELSSIRNLTNNNYDNVACLYKVNSDKTITLLDSVTVYSLDQNDSGRMAKITSNIIDILYILNDYSGDLFGVRLTITNDTISVSPTETIASTLIANDPYYAIAYDGSQYLVIAYRDIITDTLRMSSMLCSSSVQPSSIISTTVVDTTSTSSWLDISCAFSEDGSKIGVTAFYYNQRLRKVATVDLEYADGGLTSGTVVILTPLNYWEIGNETGTILNISGNYFVLSLTEKWGVNYFPSIFTFLANEDNSTTIINGEKITRTVVNPEDTIGAMNNSVLISRVGNIFILCGMEDWDYKSHMFALYISSNGETLDLISERSIESMVSAYDISLVVVNNDAVVVSYKTGLEEDYAVVPISLSGIEGLATKGIIYTEYSTDGLNNWHDTYELGDLYIRQKINDSDWSEVVKNIVEGEIRRSPEIVATTGPIEDFGSERRIFSIGQNKGIIVYLDSQITIDVRFFEVDSLGAITLNNEYSFTDGSNIITNRDCVVLSDTKFVLLFSIFNNPDSGIFGAVGTIDGNSVTFGNPQLISSTIKYQNIADMLRMRSIFATTNSSFAISFANASNNLYATIVTVSLDTTTDVLTLGEILVCTDEQIYSPRIQLMKNGTELLLVYEDVSNGIIVKTVTLTNGINMTLETSSLDLVPEGFGYYDTPYIMDMCKIDENHVVIVLNDGAEPTWTYIKSTFILVKTENAISTIVDKIEVNEDCTDINGTFYGDEIIYAPRSYDYDTLITYTIKLSDNKEKLLKSETIVLDLPELWRAYRNDVIGDYYIALVDPISGTEESEVISLDLIQNGTTVSYADRLGEKKLIRFEGAIEGLAYFDGSENIIINTSNSGTQTSSTIADFQTAVSSNTDVSGSKTKTDHISVTQAVDLDVIESNVSGHTTSISNIEAKTDFISVTQAVDLDDIETSITDLQAYGTINTISISSTLALTDANDFIQSTSATAIDITVPPNSSVAFEVGDVVEVMQYGVGTVTIVAGSGVTLRSLGSLLDVSGQYGVITLKKLGTDEWVVYGNLA